MKCAFATFVYKLNDERWPPIKGRTQTEFHEIWSFHAELDFIITMFTRSYLYFCTLNTIKELQYFMLHITHSLILWLCNCFTVADPTREGGVKNYFHSKMLMLQSDIARTKWAYTVADPGEQEVRLPSQPQVLRLQNWAFRPCLIFLVFFFVFFGSHFTWPIISLIFCYFS